MTDPGESDAGRRVVPAERGLDSPPAPDEGAVVEVIQSRVDADPDGEPSVPRVECQHCRAPVDPCQSHVQATVVVEALAGMQKFPIFCDETCWNDWSG